MAPQVFLEDKLELAVAAGRVSATKILEVKVGKGLTVFSKPVYSFLAGTYLTQIDSYRKWGDVHSLENG